MNIWICKYPAFWKLLRWLLMEHSLPPVHIIPQNRNCICRPECIIVFLFLWSKLILCLDNFVTWMDSEINCDWQSKAKENNNLPENVIKYFFFKTPNCSVGIWTWKIFLIVVPAKDYTVIVVRIVLQVLVTCHSVGSSMTAAILHEATNIHTR